MAKPGLTKGPSGAKKRKALAVPPSTSPLKKQRTQITKPRILPPEALRFMIDSNSKTRSVASLMETLAPDRKNTPVLTNPAHLTNPQTNTLFRTIIQSAPSTTNPKPTKLDVPPTILQSPPSKTNPQPSKHPPYSPQTGRRPTKAQKLHAS